MRRPPLSDHRWVVASVCLLLGVATWVVFGQTARHEFINFDDDLYVYGNPAVRGGLSWHGILWAFTHSHAANWHPLTFISHMLDCQLFGLNAGGHHVTNVLLHAATAILLFLVLRNLTATLWPTAFVAAVFAVHPLRVESVAWIAERKDVLSGLFFMLTLGAYARYVRQPRSILRYGAVLVLFALGLMCKPMLVTLPFVLLLLDYWPLGRVSGVRCQVSRVRSRGSCGEEQATGPSTIHYPLSSLGRLVLEKVPLFLLAAVSCFITVLAQRTAIRPAGVVSLPQTFGNAFVSYVTYMAQLFYPAKLAAFYPYPIQGLRPWQIGFALLLLVAVSLTAYLWRRKRPYFLVGWLWYLGMLVPVIGVVQAGSQAHADRYTYLPQIGLYVLLTWLVVEFSASWRHRRAALSVGAALVLTALIVAARQQTAYWRDGESLWNRTLACTADNALAESNLGSVLFRKGRPDEAIAHCRKALQIQPDHASAWVGLGCALMQKGQMDEAIRALQEGARLQPESTSAQCNLGMALLQVGQIDAAVTHLQKGLEADPDQPEIHNNLGYAYLRKGDVREAIAHYQKAIDLKPDLAAACNNLAWVFATSPTASARNGARAIDLAERANRLSGGANPTIWRTLAAAYAEVGRFPEAIDAARLALELAVRQANRPLADALQNDLKLYQTSLPLRDTSPAP